MRDLHAGSEKRNINFARGNIIHSSLKPSMVFRQRSLIDGHASDDSASLSKPGQQFRVGYAVFLYGNAGPTQAQLLLRGSRFIERTQKFAPGVRLGSGDRGSYPEFAQSRDGFRTSRNHFYALQGRDVFVASVRSPNDGEKRSGANTG